MKTPTQEMIDRLFKPETQARIKQAGLVIIDREDLEAQLEAYNLAKEQNRVLRAHIERLEVKCRGVKASNDGGE